ncbi:hypothetical protein [Nonomuraea sp. NPDC005501]|uniref:hypothetical protein n=1 Tax=Nonomuraea sp. NPDC005501 TaxID=3156884 RepID=UPI0033A68DC3
MKITLPVPASLTCRFVVAVERLPCPVPELVPWRVGRPFRKAAMTAYGTPGLEVAPQAPLPPWEDPHPTPWRPTAATLHHDERQLLRRARHHLVVSSTAPPHALPGNAQVARATARALARQCGGLVIDPLTGTTVPHCDRCPDEPAEFRPADDWLGWDIQVHDDATCPPWDPADTAACDCLRVTSRGLRRFALPEITIDGAACAHTLCATNLLRAVAHRLVADHLTFLAAHPEADVRVIDDHLHIGPPAEPLSAISAERPRPPGCATSVPAAVPAAVPAPPATSVRAAVQARATSVPAAVHARRATSVPAAVQARRATSSAATAFDGPSFGVRLTPCEPQAPGAGRPGSVRRLKVAPVPGTGQAMCLKVGPPSGFTGSLNDWLCATQEANPLRHTPSPYPLAA